MFQHIFTENNTTSKLKIPEIRLSLVVLHIFELRKQEAIERFAHHTFIQNVEHNFSNHKNRLSTSVSMDGSYLLLLLIAARF